MVIDVNLPPENPQQNFEDFFREYEDTPNHFKYREAIQNAARIGETKIYILFEDLLSFDPPLADFLRDEPEVALKYAAESFKELIRFYTGGTLSKKEYIVRVSTNNQSNEVQLRELRAEHIDRLVYVYGILIRASQIIPQITIATFQCPVCQTQMEIEQIETTNLIPPRQCANPSCQNKSGFIVVSKDSKFIDWQSIRLQELPEELKAGRVPYSVKSILTDDLVDKARPGDRVKITGIYKIYPNESSRGKQTTLFTPYIKVLSIQGRSSDEEEIEISPQDMQEIRRWSKTPNIQKTVARSLAPGIMGRDHLKLATALALFGGVRKEFKDQAALRGDIHVIFIGDPGTGKSQILKQAANASPQSMFTSGRGSSAAGLTAGVVKESESGGMSLEAGALVLADGGVALIDEFDKMSKNDRSAIHEAMEQQTISVAKAGIIATLRSRTSIIAAANPQWGRYNDEKSPTDNINLSPTILTRFDLIFIVRDVPSEEDDRNLANFILQKHAQDFSEDKPDSLTNTMFIPFDILKKYIKYARTLKPKLSREAVKEISDFYVNLRTDNKRKQEEGGDVAVPIVARSLEGFVRLSEAYAKMELAPYVTREHAQEALKLAQRSIEDTTKDPLTGELNVDTLFTGVGSAKKKLFKLLDLLRKEIDATGGKSIKREDFIEAVVMDMNLEPTKVEVMLNNLHKEGAIFEPKVGLIAISKKKK